MQRDVSCGKLREGIATTGSAPMGNPGKRFHLLEKAELFKPGRISLRKKRKRSDQKAGKIFTYSFRPA